MTFATKAAYQFNMYTVAFILLWVSYLQFVRILMSICTCSVLRHGARLHCLPKSARCCQIAAYFTTHECSTKLYCLSLTRNYEFTKVARRGGARKFRRRCLGTLCEVTHLPSRSQFVRNYSGFRLIKPHRDESNG
jgi:hypothetical protein